MNCLIHLNQNVYRQQSHQINHLPSISYQEWSWLDLLSEECLLVPCILPLWETYFSVLFSMQLPSLLTRLRAEECFISFRWLFLPLICKSILVSKLCFGLTYGDFICCAWFDLKGLLNNFGGIPSGSLYYLMRYIQSKFRSCESWSLYKFGGPL